MRPSRIPENTVLIQLKDGTVIVELLVDIAPGHCARMKELARGGEYDNVAFHPGDRRLHGANLVM
jgi:peptidylprolyl isomerase